MVLPAVRRAGGKARLEQVPYPRWRDDGLLQVIEGPVIEPDAIASHIIDLLWHL